MNRSSMNRSGRLANIALGASLAFASQTFADVTVGGTGSNSIFPLGFEAGTRAPDGSVLVSDPTRTLRMQQIYKASAFPAVQTISGVRFRPSQAKNLAIGWAYSANFTVVIRMSTTTVGPVPDDAKTTAVLEPGTVSATFADNYGADSVVVFSGDVTVSTTGGNAFDISLPFSQSYVFDPSKGNLLLDIQVIKGPHLLSGGWPSPFTGNLEPEISPVESGYANFGNPEFTSVLAYDANETVGSLNPDAGVRTQFVTSTTTVDNNPVPVSSGASLSVKTAGGKGRVISDTGIINCGSVCSASVVTGTVVALTAIPDPGFRFVSWTGACTSTSATCVLPVTGKAQAQANFTK